MFDVIVHICAERFLDACENTLRARLLDVCDGLGADPFVDGQSKFVWLAPPAVFRLWSDSEYWVIYRLDDSDTVHVYNIGKEGRDEPDFRC